MKAIALLLLTCAAASAALTGEEIRSIMAQAERGMALSLPDDRAVWLPDYVLQALREETAKAEEAAQPATIPVNMMPVAGRAVASAPAGPVTNSVTLEWNPSPDVTTNGGYEIYFGPKPGGYTNAINVGNLTNVTLNHLVWGHTYYFAATAHEDGAESDFSNEVAYTVPSVPDPELGIAVERFKIEWWACDGIKYTLQWSTNPPAGWTTYAVMQAGMNMTARFLVTNDAPQKFWRVVK